MARRQGGSAESINIWVTVEDGEKWSTTKLLLLKFYMFLQLTIFSYLRLLKSYESCEIAFATGAPLCTTVEKFSQLQNVVQLRTFYLMIFLRKNVFGGELRGCRVDKKKW